MLTFVRIFYCVARISSHCTNGIVDPGYNGVDHLPMGEVAFDCKQSKVLRYTHPFSCTIGDCTKKNIALKGNASGWFRRFLDARPYAHWTKLTHLNFLAENLYQIHQKIHF